MLTIENIVVAREAVIDFLVDHGSTVPEDVRTRIRALSASPSPVDQIVKTAEFLYARREDLSAEARELGAGLADYACNNGWHGLGGTERRGNKIARALDRDNGEENGQAPEDDPSPLAEFTTEPVIPPAPVTP